MGKEWLERITLVGNLVTLEPLSPIHKDELLAASDFGNMSELWYTTIPNHSTIDNYFKVAFDGLNNKTMLPFVVKINNTNEVIGTTRFLNIDTKNKRLEIGYTWYGLKHHKTGVNTECKYLLLKHAFETLNAIAVEFRTNWYNFNSRQAISRLGAKQDGVLRNHRILADGIIRDTVVFSIINSEWPSVKYNLEYKMNKQY